MESTVLGPAYGLDPMIVGSIASPARSQPLPGMARTTRRRSAMERLGPASATGGMTSRRRPKLEPLPAPVIPPTSQDIRARAYELYLERNGGPGDALSDWLRAEQELLGANEEAVRRASARRAAARSRT